MLFLQVLGYFIKYSAEDQIPPLLFVLSEKVAKLVLFLLVNKLDQQVVESVILSDHPLWVEYGVDEGKSLNYSLLLLLLLLVVPVSLVQWGMCILMKAHRKDIQAREYAF